MDIKIKSSRCDKKVWDIWDEGEAEVAVNFSKEAGTIYLLPQYIHRLEQ